MEINNSRCWLHFLQHSLLHCSTFAPTQKNRPHTNDPKENTTSTSPTISTTLTFTHLYNILAGGELSFVNIKFSLIQDYRDLLRDG